MPNADALQKKERDPLRSSDWNTLVTRLDDKQPKIEPDSLPGTVLQDGSVPGGKLADGSVTAAKLQDSTLPGDKVVDASLTARKLAWKTTTASERLAGGRSHEVWKRSRPQEAADYPGPPAGAAPPPSPIVRVNRIEANIIGPLDPDIVIEIVEVQRYLPGPDPTIEHVVSITNPKPYTITVWWTTYWLE